MVVRLSSCALALMVVMLGDSGLRLARAAVCEVRPDPAFPSREFAPLAVYHGALYLSGPDSWGLHQGDALWRYDAVTQTAVRVRDINQNEATVGDAVLYNDALYFRASPNGNPGAEYIFYKLDDAGVRPMSFSGKFPAVAQGSLYFIDNNSALSAYDGTTTTTVPGTGGFALRLTGGMGAFNNVVYFGAGREGDGIGNELYSYDGTAVRLAADIDPHDPFFGSNPSFFMNWNGALYFEATNGVSSGGAGPARRLYRFDGVAPTPVDLGAYAGYPIGVYDNKLILRGSPTGLLAYDGSTVTPIDVTNWPVWVDSVVEYDSTAYFHASYVAQSWFYRLQVGDADGVNGPTPADYTIWADNYFALTGPATYADGDFDRDGALTGNDYRLWNQSYNCGLPAAASAAAALSVVPEPATGCCVAVAAAICGLGLFGRRQRA